MKKAWRIILLALFVVISGAAFPIYNFGKHYTYALTGITLYLNIVCYWELGVFEKKILKLKKAAYAAFLNIDIVLAGMLCRYLLEWGEVSNTYNFTTPNILLHITAATIISTISYLLTQNKSATPQKDVSI